MCHIILKIWRVEKGGGMKLFLNLKNIKISHLYELFLIKNQFIFIKF
jgi:hypothetical protein